jgi:Rod binding domain-containing protein
MPDITMTTGANAPQQPARRPDSALRQAATALEASFLNEMLKSAGLGAVSQTFGGGAGEEQFASFLRQEQAGAMARAGGIGLADALFAALAKGQEDA